MSHNTEMEQEEFELQADKELVQLHNSLPQGLPEVPSEIVEYARQKTMAEQMRCKAEEGDYECEIWALKHRSYQLEALQKMLELMEKDHQEAARSVTELLKTR